MSWFSKNQFDISNLIFKNRWYLVAFLGLVALAFEVSEHIEAGRMHVDGHFWREIVYFAFMVPMIIGYVLTILHRSENMKSQLTEQLNLENNLIQKMSNAQTWHDLTSIVLHFPRKVAPFSTILLQLYNMHEAEYETVATWHDDDQINIKSKLSRFAEVFKENAENILNSKNDQESPEIRIYIGEFDELNCYSLPLINGNVPVAILHLFLPATNLLSTERIELLTNVAPAIAFAIDNLQPNGAGVVRALATQTERKRLARYLHDSLGQNLGYLVIKLDYLKGEDLLEEVGAIRQELTQMHYVANQAYEQIRSTLTQLRETKNESVVDLDAEIHKEVKCFCEKKGIVAEVVQTGVNRPVPNQIRNRVVGIIREAITNVEKHAQVYKVKVSTNWSSEDVSISIQDDGQGFDISSLTANNGHYGLAMMKERAQEINGRLAINSQPGKGTEIVVQVPLVNNPFVM